MNWLHIHAEAIGFWAGIMTTVSFAPQLVRTWQKGGHGLSWGMVVLFGAGVGLWLTYGLLTDNSPIILANLLTEMQIVAIAAVKVWKR